MKNLYHHPVCPLSRQIRLYLRELNINFDLIREEYWLQNTEFLKLNPAGTLPILQESSGITICGIYPITEYLNDKYPNFQFFNENSDINIEVRRMLVWFNDKFYREVTKIIIDEKFIRLMAGLGAPKTELLKKANANLSHHLNYLTQILEQKSFFASNQISSADVAASCHLSVLDYFGEINWDKYPVIKDWYSTLKSRPSFRVLLSDQLPGFAPSITYADLDF